MYQAGGLAFVTTKESKRKFWDKKFHFIKFHLLSLSSSNVRDSIILLKMFTELTSFATGQLRGK